MRLSETKYFCIHCIQKISLYGYETHLHCKVLNVSICLSLCVIGRPDGAFGRMC